MEISEKEVSHIAHLARLELSSEEKKRFGGQLVSILAYVDQLKDFTNSQADGASGATNPNSANLVELRADTTDQGRYQTEIIKQSPSGNIDKNLIVVPNVFGS